MNPKRMSISRLSSVATALAAAVVVAGGCDLNVENPNAPDAKRAFQDPAGLQQLLGGAFRSWVGTRGNYYILALDAMADNYTASWNNAAMRYYTSVGVECPSRCGWANSATAPEAAGGPTVESSWYGYYSVLSSATDVVKAIADGLCFDDDCTKDNTTTSRNKAIGKMLQGMALAGVGLLYDQGFVVDETTDVSQIRTAAFNTRQELRDAALAKFEEAYAEAGSKTWETEPEWMGVGAGTAYTNAQIRKVIRTMEAELIAMWPRNAAENTAADWAKVATYASQGISAAPAFDWEFYIDISGRELDEIKTWGNSIGTERVDTRVAHMLSLNHQDPWPGGGGNPCPFSAGIYGTDKRVGDGSWGPEDDFSGYATKTATANAGTDYACSGVVIFPPARGQYHQSNMTHVRYSRLGYGWVGEGLPDDDGTGQDPMYTTQMNDLLWAEGLIRSGGSAVQAAQLINNSRVGRGGLSGLTGLEGTAALLAALQYEQEIEFMGQGTDPFFNRRRVDGLIAGTPRHMPVPAKELDVLLKEVYTFGGPGKPELSVVAGSAGASGNSSSSGSDDVRSVREIWKDYQAMARAASSRRR